MSLIARSRLGTRRLATLCAAIIGMAAAAAGVALVVVLPLWLAATRASHLYTTIVLVIAGGGALVVLIRSVRSGGVRTIVRGVLGGAAGICLVVAGYAVAVLIAGGQLLFGLPLAVILLFLLSILAGGSNGR